MKHEPAAWLYNLTKVKEVQGVCIEKPDDRYAPLIPLYKEIEVRELSNQEIQEEIDKLKGGYTAGYAWVYKDNLMNFARAILAKAYAHKTDE